MFCSLDGRVPNVDVRSLFRSPDGRRRSVVRVCGLGGCGCVAYYVERLRFSNFVPVVVPVVEVTVSVVVRLLRSVVRSLRSLVVLVVIRVVVVVALKIVVVICNTVVVVIRNRSLVRVRVIKRMGAVGEEIGDFVIINGVVVGVGKANVLYVGRWFVVNIVLGIIDGLIRAPLDD